MSPNKLFVGRFWVPLAVFTGYPWDCRVAVLWLLWNPVADSSEIWRGHSVRAESSDCTASQYRTDTNVHGHKIRNEPRTAESQFYYVETNLQVFTRTSNLGVGLLIQCIILRNTFKTVVNSFSKKDKKMSKKVSLIRYVGHKSPRCVYYGVVALFTFLLTFTNRCGGFRRPFYLNFGSIFFLFDVF